MFHLKRAFNVRRFSATKFLVILFLLISSMCFSYTRSFANCIEYLSADSYTVPSDGESSILLKFKILCPGSVTFYLGSNDLDCSSQGMCGTISFSGGGGDEDEEMYAHYTAPYIEPSEHLSGKVQVYIMLEHSPSGDSKGIYVNVDVGSYDPPPPEEKKKSVTLRGVKAIFPDGSAEIIGTDETKTLSISEDDFWKMKYEPIDSEKSLIAFGDVLLHNGAKVSLNGQPDFSGLDYGEGVSFDMIPTNQVVIVPGSIAGELYPWNPALDAWRMPYVNIKTQKKVEAIFYERFKKFFLEEGAETAAIFVINTVIPSTVPITSVYQDVDGVMDFLELFGPLTDAERDQYDLNAMPRSILKTDIKKTLAEDPSGEAVPYFFSTGSGEVEVLGEVLIDVNHSATTVYVYSGEAKLSDPDSRKKVVIQAGRRSSCTSNGLPEEPASFDTSSILKWWETGKTFEAEGSDFSESDEDWTDDGSGCWSLKDDAYVMTGAKRNSINYAIYDKEASDFAFRADVRKTSGDSEDYVYSYGLCLRSDGTWRNNYELNIIQDGRFMIARNVDGAFTKLVDWTRSGALIAGSGEWNTLKAIGKKDTLDFYANGTLLASIKDSSHPTGKCGLFAIDAASSAKPDVVEFDNMILVMEENHCVPVENDIGLPVVCAEYDGAGFTFSLDFVGGVPSDPSGLYWKLDLTTVGSVPVKTGCLGLADDLSLAVTCAELAGECYGFVLHFMGNIKDDPANYYWKMDLESFLIK